jgi:hypothetical protein
MEGLSLHVKYGPDDMARKSVKETATWILSNERNNNLLNRDT